MTLQLFQYDPVFGYRFIPGLKTRLLHESGGYLVRVNEAGFRCDHEFDTRKPPGVFRILLFGDSFTAGDGVSNGARYGDVLERALPGVEVYNFGLPGSGTDQQLLIFREYAKKIEHDLVIVGILVENVRRIAARYRIVHQANGSERVAAKPYFTLDSGALTLHHAPVPRELKTLESLPEAERRWVDVGGPKPRLRGIVKALGPRVKAMVQRITRYQPVPAFSRPDHPDWLLMRAILEQWISESETPVILVPIPLYQFIEETADARPYQARFAELSAVSGVHVHDPLADFHALPPGSARRAMRFPTDVHLTPAAHELLGRSLARAVRRYMSVGAAA